MTLITWDGTGEKVFEAGVDHGVLYMPNGDGEYDDGVAWNGLITVTESPTGAESNKTYADNIVYANLVSLEEFEGSIDAYMYPTEFAEFDGAALPAPGLAITGQLRKPFGLSWRTLIGNDVDGLDFGYKLHLAYGLTASPSEKAHGTLNDSPEPTELSWDVVSVPVNVTGLRPTSKLTITSTDADPTALAALEAILYGASADPRLPFPDEVASILGGAATASNITVAPATDAVAIGGTTTNVRFTIEHWDGDEWISDGENLSEAAAEALTLVTGTVYKVELSALTGNYIPSAQQTLYYVVPT